MKKIDRILTLLILALATATLAVVLVDQADTPDRIRIGTAPTEDSQITFDAGRADYEHGVWYVNMP